MSVVKGNPEVDFWEQNPALKFKYEYKELIKSEGLKEASNIMWATYLIEDPDSPFFRIPREDRIKEVQEQYYNIDPVKFKHILDSYSRISMSKEEAMFKVHIDTMDRLTSYLKELDLGQERDFNKIVRIMEKLPKMWEGLEKVKTKMIETQNKTNIRGGAKQSAREKRT